MRFSVSSDINKWNLQLTYTRGTVIPLHLIMKSSDKQVVDLLANPQAPRIQMRRRLKGPTRVSREGASRAVPSIENSVEHSGVAWTALQQLGTIDESGSDGVFSRKMMGEVYLPSNLTPSFTFGEFDLKVRRRSHCNLIY